MKFVLNAKHDMAVRRVVLMLGVAGALMCGVLFAVSWFYPTVLETWARKAIAEEVQQRVETHLDGLNNSAIGRAAGGLIDKNNREKAAAREQMAKVLPSRISIVIVAMLDPECRCRGGLQRPGKLAEVLKTAKQFENASLAGRIARLDEANDKLTALIASKYRDVAQSLLREVRIFSGANGIVFLLLAIIALIWKRSAMQLIAPAIVLVGAASITAMIYLFNQNWLQTILLNNYVGLCYLPYLGIALAFMLDVVFNAARVTSLLLNVVGSVIGTVFSACG